MKRGKKVLGIVLAFLMVLAVLPTGSMQAKAGGRVITIDVQPEDATVGLEEEATLVVGASIVPAGALSYQWYADGEMIPGATLASYTADTSEYGETEYYVEISADGAETVTSDVVTVTVTDEPDPGRVYETYPIYDVDEGYNTAIVGDHAGFTEGEAGIKCGTGKNVIMFSKTVSQIIPANATDIKIEFDSSVVSSTKNFFMVTQFGNDQARAAFSATSDENGHFEVELDSVAGLSLDSTFGWGLIDYSGATFESVYISYLVPAAEKEIIINEDPADTTVKVGDDAYLSVDATVEPEGTLSYQWFVDDVAIPGATAASCKIDTSVDGEYIYFVRISAEGAETVDSEEATVTVEDGGDKRKVMMIFDGSFDANIVNVASGLDFLEVKGEKVNYTNGWAYGAILFRNNLASYLPADAQDVKLEFDSTLLNATKDIRVIKQYYVKSNYSAISSTSDKTGHFTVDIADPANMYGFGLVPNASGVSLDNILVSYVSSSAGPTITINSQPESIGVTVGQEALLSVEASVEPAGTLSYQWYKDGSVIEGATEATYSADTSAVGEAEYYVVVSATGAEDETSDTATVTVSAQPATKKIIIYDTKGQGLKTSVTSWTESKDGTDSVLENGTWTPYNARVNIGTQDFSEIKDTAVLHFTMKSVAGADTSFTVRLYGGDWGSDLIEESAVMGCPNDNKYHDYEMDLSDFNNDLSVIKGIGIKCSGTHNMFKNLYITYEGGSAPEITINKQPENKNVPVGGEAILSVEASVEPEEELSYQWYKDGEAITGATQNTYAADTSVKGEAEYYVIVSAQDAEEVVSDVVTVTVGSTKKVMTIFSNGTYDDPGDLLKGSSSLAQDAGKTVIKTAAWEDWMRIIFPATRDWTVAGNGELKMDVKSSSATMKFCIYYNDGWQTCRTVDVEGYNANEYRTVTVPLNEFPGLDITSVRGVGIASYNTSYVDNIRLEYEAGENDIQVSTFSESYKTGISVANVTGGGNYGPGYNPVVKTTEVYGYTFMGWYRSVTNGSGKSDYEFVSKDLELTDTRALEETDIAVSYKAVYALDSMLKLSVKADSFKITENSKAPVSYQESFSDTYKAGTNHFVIEYTGTKNFKYWVNDNGVIVGQSPIYTFDLAVNTELKAVAVDEAQTVSTVVFLSESNQLIKSIPVASGEDFNMPNVPVRLGRNGNWDMTKEDIKAAVLSGVKTIVVKAIYDRTEDQNAIKLQKIVTGTKSPMDYANWVAYGTAQTVQGYVADAFSLKVDAQVNPGTGAENFLFYGKYDADKKEITVLSYNNECNFRSSSEKDEMVYAVYGNAEIVKTPTVTMTNTVVTNKTTSNTFTYSFSYEVPETCEVVAQGLLYGSNPALGSKSAIVPDKANEELVLDGAKAYKYTSNGKDLKGITTVNVNGIKSSNTQVYGRAYVTYKNIATGAVATIYSKIFYGTASDTELKELTGLAKKYIALTLDDGPNGTTMLDDMNIFTQFNARATFFLIGDNITGREDIVRDGVARGHEFESHSMKHQSMKDWTKEQIIADMNAVKAKIEPLTGKEIKFFRSPYLHTSKTMCETIDLTWINGFDSLDSQETSVAERVSRVISLAHDGAIILMHCSDTGNSAKTTEALYTILPALQSQGYEFVTLEELFKIKGVEPVTNNGGVSPYAAPYSEVK